MCRKVLLISLIVSFAITSHAQLLFRISGGGLEKPSYMLGSVHVLSGTLLDSIPSFIDAEKQCRQLFVECNVTDQQNRKALHEQGKKVMTLPEGKTILDVLGKEKMDVLQERMKESCHIDLTDPAAEELLSYQPLVFTTSLTLMISFEALQKYPGLAKGDMMDGVCIARAKEREWKVGELDRLQKEEDLAKTKEALDQSIDEQADSLMALLNNYDERKQQQLKEFERMIRLEDYWGKGDYEGFESYMLPEVEAAPTLFRNRNEKWTPIMTEAMKEQPTLFVFGAGHLVGPHGVVSLLREAGYEVEQVSSGE